MEFKESQRETELYTISFDILEATAVGAAYREHLHELASKGNSGSISDYDVWVASWDPETPQEINTSHPNQVVEVLQQFWDRTDESIGELPDSVGVAPFQSTDIATRHQLGKIAGKLAETISQEESVYIEASSLPDEFNVGNFFSAPEDQ